MTTEVRPQPLLCVRDVEASSRWYQRLLDCQSEYGGHGYARLFSNGRLIMQLHDWDAEHEHGPIGDPTLAHGNGVLVWFEIDDFDVAVARAEEMQVEVVLPRRRNPRPNTWEIWLRDPDGYTVVLASPDGSAPDPI